MNHPRVLILNGPGLSELSNGSAGSDGALGLQEITRQCESVCHELNLALEFRQADDEEQLLHWITGDFPGDNERHDGLIINPVGGSSAASADFERIQAAIERVAHHKKPVIEVHISNIFKPGAENILPLRVAGSATGFVSGLGVHGYVLAIRSISQQLSGQADSPRQIRPGRFAQAA